MHASRHCVATSYTVLLSGQVFLFLLLVLLEIKKERPTTSIFIDKWFRNTQLFLLFLVMIERKFAGDYMTVKVRNLESIPALRYLVFCNVLHRVYQLHDFC